MSQGRILQIQSESVSHLNGDYIDVVTNPHMDKIARLIVERTYNPASRDINLRIRSKSNIEKSERTHKNVHPYQKRSESVNESPQVVRAYINARHRITPTESKKQQKFYRFRYGRN